jgi:glycosyltransferase involved in cell wall biosynthesis
MRILFVPEYDYFGGTFTFARRVVEVHGRRGWETLLAIAPGQPPVPAAESNGASLVPLAPRPGWGTRAYLSLAADVLMLWPLVRRYRPDLVHISTGTPGLYLGSPLLPRPVLVTLHTYPVVRARSGVRQLSRLLATRDRKRFATVSRYSAERVTWALGVPPERISVVPNSYDEVDVPADRSGASILTVGSVGDTKDPATWLEVARRVIAQRPSARFIWVGGGSKPGDLERWRSRAAELGASAAFEGHNPDPRPFHAAAAIYFQPSTQESQGISILDAMAHGLPCVVSDVGGIPESVTHGVTGFCCPPGDAADFARRCIQLLDDLPLREAMGAAGQQLARQLFSPRAFERKLLEAYSTILHEPSPKIER